MNATKEFKDYLGKITKEDKVLVYCGPDSDSICSSVLFAKIIERKNGRSIDYVIAEKSNKPGISIENRRFLRQNRINKLIILDIAIDNADPETLEEILKYDTLIIDHHQIVKDLSSERTSFIKPPKFSNIASAQYPTSKIVFDLASDFVELSDLDWICGVGVIADSSYKTWKEFIDKIIKKYNLKSEDNIWQSDLGLICSYLSSAMIVDPLNYKECFEKLSKAKEPKDILNSDLGRFKKDIDACIAELINEFSSKSESYPELDLVFYQIKPKYKVGSPLSTIISFKQPDKTLIVLQENYDVISADARRQDGKVNLADLMKKSVEGFENASGGGHIPAAGATFKKKDLQKFKENIKRNLSLN